jgi:LemA protein
MAVLLIVIAIVVLLVLFSVFMYNGLIRRRNQVENAWAQIDVQLKRRIDLIPNLVETVKAYAAHEKETLEPTEQSPARCARCSLSVRAIQISKRTRTSSPYKKN